MGQRVVRVNELVKREISHVLHTRHRAESVHISILGVDVSPNLRKAKVFAAVVREIPVEIFEDELIVGWYDYEPHGCALPVKSETTRFVTTSRMLTASDSRTTRFDEM